MGHTIELSDEVFNKLQQMAVDCGESPEALVAGFISLAASTAGEQHYYELDDWFRHLGMTDEEMAEADAELEAEEALDANAQ